MLAVLRDPMWYWRRAAAMSAAELLHRLGEQAKRSVSRRTRCAPPAVDVAAEILPIPGLAAGVAELTADPEIRAQWRALSDEFRDGRMVILGRVWPAADERAKWHVDPVTGTSWPDRKYCFDIAYRHDTMHGDIKFVWERNRLQYLQSVAAFAHATGDADLARLCVAEIESWIDANPPFLGVNWASGIELATRVVSILVVCSLLGPAAISGPVRAKIAGTLAAHGYWLMRFPSRFSSANNHLIAEAAGLYLLGALVPGLDAAPRYRAYGFATLAREALRQIHGDGVGAEQSLTYTASTIEWLLLCAEVGGRLGEVFPAAYWERLLRAGHFLASITDCCGHQPRIGDDDEGHVLDYRGPRQLYETSVLAGLAKAARGTGAVPGAHLLHALSTGRPRPAAPAYGLQVFAEGGYSVSRSLENGIECLLLFDHGPLGYLSIAAHGHADTLAVWLHLDGAPVLTDGGTYLYHSGEAWRTHFRGSAAHSTLLIAGEDSSVAAGRFNWRHTASARLVSVGHEAGRWHIEAEHSGYRDRFGVTHRRRVERNGPGRFVVVDRVEGASVEGEIGFLIDPACGVERDGDAWEIRAPNGCRLRLEHDGALAAAVERGESRPTRGWHSSAFGERVATPRLRFAGRLGAGRDYVFTLAVSGTEIAGGERRREPVLAEQQG